jgi:hypothetical protein
MTVNVFGSTSPRGRLRRSANLITPPRGRRTADVDH